MAATPYTLLFANPKASMRHRYIYCSLRQGLIVSTDYRDVKEPLCLCRKSIEGLRLRVVLCQNLLFDTRPTHLDADNASLSTLSVAERGGSAPHGWGSILLYGHGMSTYSCCYAMRHRAKYKTVITITSSGRYHYHG